MKDVKIITARDLKKLYAVKTMLDDLLEGIGEVDRSNLAKYLTIAKLRLENAITLVRRGDAG